MQTHRRRAGGQSRAILLHSSQGLPGYSSANGDSVSPRSATDAHAAALFREEHLQGDKKECHAEDFLQDHVWKVGRHSCSQITAQKEADTHVARDFEVYVALLVVGP